MYSLLLCVKKNKIPVRYLSEETGYSYHHICLSINTDKQLSKPLKKLLYWAIEKYDCKYEDLKEKALEELKG